MRASHQAGRSHSRIVEKGGEEDGHSSSSHLEGIWPAVFHRVAAQSRHKGRHVHRNLLRNRSKYNILARGVATDVFRAIEKYLHHRVEITPTSKEHLSLVLDLILRCRTLMVPEDCLNFRRTVRKAFKIPSPTLTLQEVARVYVAVQY